MRVRLLMTGGVLLLLFGMSAGVMRVQDHGQTSGSITGKICLITTRIIWRFITTTTCKSLRDWYQ